MSFKERVNSVFGDIRRSGWFGYLFAVIVIGTGVLSLWAILQGPKSQPISISACNANSITGECPPFAGLVQPVHPVDEPVAVAGEICNKRDETIAVQFLVGYQSIGEPGLSYTILDVGGDIRPGCVDYQFDYAVPAQMINEFPSGNYGRWKIIGKAIPVDPGLPVYQWDLSGVFRIVD